MAAPCACSTPAQSEPRCNSKASNGTEAPGGRWLNIRGGDRLAKIERNIRRSGGISTLHFLTGHIGSGKTTEMLRLRQRLDASSGATGNTVFYLDADTMLDRNDVDLEDIVVALWDLVFRVNSNAASDVLTKVWKEQVQQTLKELVVNLPDRVPDAVGAVLGQLKLPGLDQRQKVRVRVGSLLGALLDGLNLAFAKVRNEPSDSIVLLIDNLEKLSEGQRKGVEHLYVQRMGTLKQLGSPASGTARPRGARPMSRHEVSCKKPFTPPSKPCASRANHSQSPTSAPWSERWDCSYKSRPPETNRAK